jgi:EAL domain-containing protein (putative c-di-GMP-specific phosphodiesterase class I)
MASTAQLIADLKSAIHGNQFELYYQPQFNIALSKVVSVEALIRWNHPERGMISPNDFIPVAEQNGLLPVIGNWVIEEACRQGALWLHRENMPLRIAVNISADHFFQPDFVSTVLTCLKNYDFPSHLFELEVTESLAMNDIDTVVKSLNTLRESSIHVALDDFGTGYSSLGYLQDLPLDTLKIDKSFIQKMQQGNLQHDSITETIVALGKTLQLETVAEGVETIDQLTAVSDMRISVVQGYYYSQPVCADDLPSTVRRINDGNAIQKAA